MQLRTLWLRDFRGYEQAELHPAPGLTAVVGENGQGKSNLLEAVAYLATLESFRGAPTEAMVRVGADTAVVRAELERDGRELLVEAELSRHGRNRVHVNKQRLRRARDLLGALRVTVFAPDDLAVVKEGPALRRRYVDELVVALTPRHDALRMEVDRVLRQRSALVRQVAGTRPERLAPDVAATLDVWDAKLAEAGEALAAARRRALAELGPGLEKAYGQVTPRGGVVAVSYQSTWPEGGLLEALQAARADDLRRGVTTVGPHRDDVLVELDGLPARLHASQGEQRSLALALRLAGHDLVTAAIGSPPLLLLDDVFSELDPFRSAALVAHLPAGQTLLTTASGLPPGAVPDLVVEVHEGRLR